MQRMNVLRILILVVLAFVLAYILLAGNQSAPQLPTETPQATEGGERSITPSNPTTMALSLSSPAFEDGEMIPQKYTCDGDNMSPPLQFKNVPEGTQSLALIVADPDAPSDTWYHWVIFDIPGDTSGFDENTVPAAAILGSNTRGGLEYTGPCPPQDETHNYIFNLYALDTTLTLPSGSTQDAVTDAMEGHILESAQLSGRFTRQ